MTDPYRHVKCYTGAMSPTAVLFLVLILGAVASVVTLIIRGISNGPGADAEVLKIRQERRAAGALPGLTIRPLSGADRLVWSRLWDNYCDFFGTSVPEDVTEVTWKRLLDPASPVKGWGAFDAEGALVGFAHTVLHPHTWSEKTLCYLEDLYVSPSVRGRDVGYSLIRFLWTKAEDEGWGRVYWHTQGTNAAARRLYDRFRPADGYVRYTLTVDRKPEGLQR